MTTASDPRHSTRTRTGARRTDARRLPERVRLRMTGRARPSAQLRLGATRPSSLPAKPSVGPLRSRSGFYVAFANAEHAPKNSTCRQWVPRAPARTNRLPVWVTVLSPTLASPAGTCLSTGGSIGSTYGCPAPARSPGSCGSIDLSCAFTPRMPFSINLTASTEQSRRRRRPHLVWGRRRQV